MIPRLLALFFVLAPWAGAAEPETKPPEGPVTLDHHITPVLQKFCFDCHNPDKMKGDVDLTKVAKDGNLQANRAIWEKVVSSVEGGDMPPEKKPQLSGEQRELIVHFLDGQLSKIDCSKEKDPGRVTLRRLNREEYKHTILDLLRVQYDANDFPNDEVGYGFDNIADVLSLSPMLMEKYMDAAEEISHKAILAGPAKPQVKQFLGKEFGLLPKEAGGATDEGTLGLSSNGDAVRNVEFPAKGTYKLRIKAAGDQAGPDPVKMAVHLAERDLGVIEVKAPAKKAQFYELTVEIDKPNWQKLTLSFTNDYYDLKNADPRLRGDSNLYIERVELEYPPGTASLPESHRKLITKMPEAGEEKAVARELLAPFLRRAYRRPVTPAEVDRVAQFVDLAVAKKATFLEGMQVAVQAILSSPQFLFRWELDPGALKPALARDLNDVEVASRLSYFLWSSMPDDPLLDLAEKGELRKDGNLEKQIARMLKDWRARYFVNNFADQWLQIRNIYEVTPDPQTFPAWQDDLKGMMKEETERFFEEIVKSDRPVSDLLDADYSFLNERLANFYGVSGVQGPEFRKVTLPADSPRGGVLTQGAVLLATSTPTRTSPVIRGKWILEQILGTPPPAPPANVPPLTEQKSVNQTASLRERFSQHSKDAMCAGCHKRMDPLGFALENFDATGAWRDVDGKFPIDASGKLADGRQFKNAKELKGLLKSGDLFLPNLVEKLMTYALGRGLDPNDRCAIRGVVDRAKKDEGRFSALVTGIVLSDPFLKRKTSDVLTKN